MSFEHSGRRPKPTAVHRLNGNPSRKHLNDREPKALTGPVVMPTTLSPGAQVVWERLAPVCMQMQTLTGSDADTFGRLCELQATADQTAAEKSLPEFRLFVLSTVVDGAGNEHPQVKIHPVIRLELEISTKLRPFYEYFGLCPVGRARIQLPAPVEAPVSKWAGGLS